MSDTLSQNPSGGNIDITAPDAIRASAFNLLIAQVSADMDGGSAAAIKSFMLHLPWHEGRRLRARVQDNNGPARSFFQMEAHRAKDGCAYAAQKGWIPKLAAAAGASEADINTAWRSLSDYDSTNPANSAFYPAGNLIEVSLRTVDLFGVYLARICFKKVPAAIPADNVAQADYWYRYWKISGGDPVALKQTFLAEANEVDQLVASRIPV